MLWFRDDLRLADHPALRAAAANGGSILPCYVLDDSGPESPGAASRWWLHGSLASLARDIGAQGGNLVLRRGSTVAEIEKLVAETNAAVVHCSQSYEPTGRRHESSLRAALLVRGVRLETHAGNMLFDPERVRTADGKPFRVFTAFWNSCREFRVAAPDPVPRAIVFSRAAVRSDSLDDWRLRPHDPDWAKGFGQLWNPGEAGARARLDAFVGVPIRGYASARDRFDLERTSRLSPHLHFGEVSVRAAWSAAGTRRSASREAFLRELCWREFARHLVWHWPDFPTQSFRREFRRFPWLDDPGTLARWQRGVTGYPVVDAGMRQLWQTGWMHNRVRMVVASFLTKHLLIPWQAGARWFWDTLVDADLANNSVSWQWVAGSGPDAAPYFRIFNPALQGQKFDPQGDYVRRWVPELARMPAAFIHDPMAAPAGALREARVEPGASYPLPIVVHREARHRALRAFDTLSEGRKGR